MGRIDPGLLRAARLAGAALLALGAADVVLRGRSLSRNEDGAILLAAGGALLVLHVVLARLGDRRASDAALAAALSVVLAPVGIALIAFNPPTGPFGGDILEPFRDAASEGLIATGILYAVAYVLTRHPRWVLVVALALGFGAELQSAAPIPIGGAATDSWTPALILSGAAAVAVVAALGWRAAPAEQQNLLVATAIMLAAASEARTFGGNADAVRDLFLLAILAAEVAIAWWRTTPGVAVALAVSGVTLAVSLSQRSGWIGVAAAVFGAALAAGATFLTWRSAGGGPAATQPAAAA